SRISDMFVVICAVASSIVSHTRTVPLASRTCGYPSVAACPAASSALKVRRNSSAMANAAATSSSMPNDGPVAHPLDNVVWHALTGPRRQLGEVRGRAATFHHDVSPFGAIAAQSAEAWSGPAALVGAGQLPSPFAPAL